MSPYAKLFLAIHGFAPHDWQVDLADDTTCITRLIPIYTGLSGIDGPGRSIQCIVSKGRSMWRWNGSCFLG